MAQTVKNPSAMRETWVWSLGWEDPLEEGMATLSSILAWRIPMDRGAWWAIVHRVTKSQTWLSNYTQRIITEKIIFMHNGIIERLLGLPWWLSGKEFACQCRRHGFNLWSGKIPHAEGQLSPCATNIEPVFQSWGASTTEPTFSRSHATQEKPLKWKAHMLQWRVAPTRHN